MPSVWSGGGVCVCVRACACVCRHSPARLTLMPGVLAACSGSSSCCFVEQVNSISNTVLPVKPPDRKLSSPFGLINKHRQRSRNDIQSPQSMQVQHIPSYLFIYLFFCFNQSSILTVGHVTNTCRPCDDTEGAAGSSDRTFITSVESTPWWRQRGGEGRKDLLSFHTPETLTSGSNASCSLIFNVSIVPSKIRQNNVQNESYECFLLPLRFMSRAQWEAGYPIPRLCAEHEAWARRQLA